MCQSCRVLARCRPRSMSATSWVAGGHLFAQPVAAASAHRRVDPIAPAAGREPEPDRQQGGPVVAASSAGPAGIRAVSPKNVDVDAAAGQVPVAEQADHPAGLAAARSSTSRAARSPPVSGSTSMPRLSR